MKYVYLFIGVLLLFSCEDEKECTNPPDCFTGPTQLRFAYFDEDNQNMLEPNYPDRVEIKSVESKVGAPIDFEVTSSIGGTIETGFWYLGLTQTPFSVRPDCNGNVLECGLCLDEVCELYVSYHNRPEVDTLNVLQESVTEYDENNCPCTHYELRQLKINGVDNLNNTTTVGSGAWVINK